MLAIGKPALEMLGRNLNTITITRPIQHSVISDFSAAETMIGNYVKKTRRRVSFSRLRVAVACPLGATPAESRAIQDSTERASDARVTLVPGPLLRLLALACLF